MKERLLIRRQFRIVLDSILMESNLLVTDINQSNSKSTICIMVMITIKTLMSCKTLRKDTTRFIVPWRREPAVTMPHLNTVNTESMLMEDSSNED